MNRNRLDIHLVYQTACYEIAAYLDKTGQTPLTNWTGSTSITITGIMLAEVKFDEILFEILKMPRPLVTTRASVNGKVVVEFQSERCKTIFGCTVAEHLKTHHLSERTAVKLAQFIALDRTDIFQYYNTKSDCLAPDQEYST